MTKQTPYAVDALGGGGDRAISREMSVNSARGAVTLDPPIAVRGQSS